MSGNQISGIVETVNSKEGQYGTMWSVKVNGEWFGAGKYMPKCREGDNVTFDFTFKGNYKNMDTKTLKATTSGSSAAATIAGAAPPTTGGGGYVDNRQEVISKQAALNSAIAFMQLLHAEGGIPLAATVKGGKREGALRELLQQYTCEFYEQATGKKLVLSPVKVAKGGTEPDEGNEFPDDDKVAW
jgi:hypothetical protein